MNRNKGIFWQTSKGRATKHQEKQTALTKLCIGEAEMQQGRERQCKELILQQGTEVSMNMRDSPVDVSIIGRVPFAPVAGAVTLCLSWFCSAAVIGEVGRDSTRRTGHFSC